MAGFTFRASPSVPTPTIKTLTFKDTETISAGDMVNLEAGEVDLGATGDTAFLGCALQTVAGTDSVSKIRVITDRDAIYAVADANARKIGDTLDLRGATGAQGVAASSNKEFVVVADSLATEETLVRFNVGKHHENSAL